jgi:hypothetical protein
MSISRFKDVNQVNHVRVCGYDGMVEWLPSGALRDHCRSGMKR